MMKKTILLSAAVLLVSAVGASAQMLITAFNFNDGGASGAQATATTFGSTGGSQTSTIVSNFPAANSVVFAGTTVNAVSGDVAGNGLAVQGGTGATAGGTGGNNGDTLSFTVNTLLLANIQLTYAVQKSGTSGFGLETLAYSTGGAFTDFGTLATVPTSFTKETFALPADAENQAALTIRFTFTGATASSGNNRLDNIQLSTVAIPEPSAYALALGGLGALALVRFRRRTA